MTVTPRPQGILLVWIEEVAQFQTFGQTNIGRHVHVTLLVGSFRRFLHDRSTIVGPDDVWVTYCASLSWWRWTRWGSGLNPSPNIELFPVNHLGFGSNTGFTFTDLFLCSFPQDFQAFPKPIPKVDDGKGENPLTDRQPGPTCRAHGWSLTKVEFLDHGDGLRIDFPADQWSSGRNLCRYSHCLHVASNDVSKTRATIGSQWSLEEMDDRPLKRRREHTEDKPHQVLHRRIDTFTSTACERANGFVGAQFRSTGGNISRCIRRISYAEDKARSVLSDFQWTPCFLLHQSISTYMISSTGLSRMYLIKEFHRSLSPISNINP